LTSTHRIETDSFVHLVQEGTASGHVHARKDAVATEDRKRILLDDSVRPWAKGLAHRILDHLADGLLGESGPRLRTSIELL